MRAQQAARDQGRTVAGQILQAIGHTPSHGTLRSGERCFELLCAREGVIHHQPAIHDKGNTNGRAPRLSTVGLQRQMKNGDVECRRLAGAGRQIQHTRPFAFLRRPILVLGDPGQLPPIKGEGAFTDAESDIMLTEIHRQAAESAIIRLATMAREGQPRRWRGWSMAESMADERLLPSGIADARRPGAAGPLRCPGCDETADL